ncbi:MAG: inositol monophosphatase [Gammaproteobacteria bacterium]|nr:inositol monophosphatase [Gammaproteobacteria bacterium]
MQPMATIALRAAREAGLTISRAFDRPDLVKIDEKGHNNYVTNVDRDVERIIVEALHETYPDHSISGEEQISNIISEDAEYEWIIDPIDGTMNFVRQIPHFCVSIACLHKGKLEHGVILDPIRQEEFVVSRGKGCQLNGKRIRVSAKEVLDGAVIATSSPSLADVADANGQLARKLLDEQVIIRQQGSACLELAYVASGRLDAMWMGNLKPWDMAAGALMVIESGGLLGDFTGGAGYMKSGNLVAASPKVFKLFVPMVKQHLGGI